MSFTWMPAAGQRHATAHERPRRGDAITTLCGQFLLADGWDKLAPEQAPANCVWEREPWLWPTCWDCHDTWQQALQMAGAERGQ